MVSDEALAFVDIMRRDDMDRRASDVLPATSADERGEPTSEEITSEVVQDSQSETGADAESSELFQESGDETTPAETVSEVALGAEPLLAVSSESDVSPTQDAKIFSEDAIQQESQSVQSVPEDSPASPEEAISDDTELLFDESTLPSQAALAEYQDSIPTPQEAIGDNPVPTDSADPQASVSEESASAEALDLFSQDSTPAAANDSLSSEGVTVTDVPNESGTTTFIVPDDMPEFAEMLKAFDRDYRPPDPKAGDDIEIPAAPEFSEHDPIKSSTEVASAMVSEMSDAFLALNRRRA